jgi:Kef-type K+ transport system membrane component KefB
MTGEALLRDLGAILVGATLVALVARRAHVPGIVAYILAGLLLGPVTGLVASQAPLHATTGIPLIAEVGIALLLFLVGLELSFATIRDVGRVAFVAGSVQVFVSAALGAGVALLLGFGTGTAVFLGVALSFSSTVVVVKLLETLGDLGERYGRLSLGILLVQDLLVLIVLTFVAGLGGGATDPLQIGGDLLLAFGGMAALVALAVVAAARLLPRPFAWLAGSPEALLVSSLAWCFGMILAAEAMHLSVELGAFLAGMSLAQLPFAMDLRRRVRPLVDFFLAVFFVSLGASMDPAAAFALWPQALALTALVLLAKPIILWAVLPRLGFGERTSTLAGITLGQTSEFSFILAGLGASAGLVGPEIVALVGAVGLGTMGVSSGLILGSDRVRTVLRRIGVPRLFGTPEHGARDAGGDGHHDPVADLDDHVVVVGMNTLGRRIVEALHQRGVPTVAIDTDPEKMRAIPGHTLMGTADDGAFLETAGVPRARLVVSTLHIEGTNNLLAWRCRELGVPTAIHAFDRSVVEELRRNGASHLIESKTSGTRRIGEALSRRGVYG